MPQRRRSCLPTRIARIGLGLTTVLALGAGCVTTGAAPRVDLNFASPPRLDEVTVQRFEYPTHDTPDPEQNWADLYLPAGEQRIDTIPLAILIHGGAWQSQMGADVFDPLARKLASRGMAVYNIEYRRGGAGGGWPTTFRDVASALDHVVEVDKRFPQITTDDELVVGHSAGAQLAVWGGTRHLLDDGEVGAEPAFRPTRVVSIAGPLDMVYAANNGDDRIVTALGGTPSEVPNRYAMVDPIQNIDPSTPVVAMHGARDVTVGPENSRRYVDAVVRAGGKAKMVLFNEEDHVSLVSGDSRAYPRVLEIIRYVSEADLDEATA
ncbi:alpha/beta hydrolase family protein [Dietzia sp. PP-33]|jgi:dipeptidyl aminopeptidase/acylaminoacyl peptidase|uniref:alpha/beta hydrolase family protein n=1 Tax=Dietzia sp. PP-33 TaxID=2957500 RepID=UPI0029A56187|nr:alpha/beta fold hydrolase [Dietzia sp. PP-33]MDX2357762.1 alpha/beta fold hydrolase [Dietzia sp. PP-33]